MKKCLLIVLFGIALNLFAVIASAQCSICTRTAAQMGERPAKALNAGILYLAAVPFAMVGLISYRWWRNNREEVPVE
jgi:hypothetical protein